MKIIVTFRLMNFDSDPEFVLSQLNISGATIWRKGQTRLHSKHSYESNGWEYRVECLHGETIDVLVAKVLNAVGDSWDRVSKLPKCDAQISCVIYLAGDERPEIQFNAETIQKIAALNASIDIDVYVGS